MRGDLNVPVPKWLRRGRGPRPPLTGVAAPHRKDRGRLAADRALTAPGKKTSPEAKWSAGHPEAGKPIKGTKMADFDLELKEDWPPPGSLGVPPRHEDVAETGPAGGSLSSGSRSAPNGSARHGSAPGRSRRRQRARNRASAGSSSRDRSGGVRSLAACAEADPSMRAIGVRFRDPWRGA